MWGSFRRTALVNFEPAEGFFARIWTLLFLYQKVLSFPCSKLVIKKKKKDVGSNKLPTVSLESGARQKLRRRLGVEGAPPPPARNPPPPPIFPKGLGST